MKEQNKGQEISTEQAIMAAAEAEFLEKGYAATKTTGIARRAGVTHAMLHYYYRTKENLFEMVFRQKAQKLIGSFSVVVDGDLPFLEKVKTAIETHFDFIAANPQLPMFILNEIVRDPQRLEICKEMIGPVLPGVMARIQHEIDREAAQGTIRRVEAHQLLLDIVSLNVFFFSAQPLVQILAASIGKDFSEFLEARKRENVQVIMDRLTV